MIFGENILSRSPVDWTVVNGSMTTANIVLNPGGYATQVLTVADILAIPEEMYVSVISSTYTNPYAPVAYITIRAQTNQNTYYDYNIPLIDTGNGFCTVTFPTVMASFISLSFTIRADFAIVITDWVLAGPVADEVDFDEIRQEIPKLLDDCNTAIFTVGQEEVSIGFITAELLQNTDMNGHVLITYISPVSTLLTIRIKDNDITELYTPILYNISPGRNSIGIPHAYLKKLIGIHTFTVTAQVSTGTISIITRGMLYTIDGGYLAKRLIDIDVDITDMTIMQLPNETEPSRVFAVGIEDNMARVRHRAIKGGAGVVWEPIYEVGPATFAAIEFNGVWAERTTDLGFTILTEELPWVFWIAPNNTLYGQQGTNESTLVTLATNVSTVSVVRGYKSYQVLQNDQGLVVVYIKSGRVYYRNYATQENGVTLWEPEVEIEIAGTGNTSAYIARLNDYRLCLSVVGSSGNKLYYTGRTYAGQAFKSDRGLVTDAQIMPVIMEDITRWYPKLEEQAKVTDAFVSFQYGFTTAEFYPPNLNYFEASLDGKTLFMVFDCDFYAIDTIDPTKISVSPTNNILSIVHAGPNTLEVVFENAVDTNGSINLTFAGMHQAGYVRGGPVWFAGMVWVITFTTPEPHEQSEEALVVDATIPYFQFAEITHPLVIYDEEEHALVVDASIFGVELVPIGTEPI